MFSIQINGHPLNITAQGFFRLDRGLTFSVSSELIERITKPMIYVDCVFLVSYHNRWLSAHFNTIPTGQNSHSLS